MILQAFVAVASNAAPIYDNGLGPSDFTTFTASTTANNTHRADDFSLPMGSWAVTGITWYGSEGAVPDTSFNIRFYSDVGGKPAGDGTANGYLAAFTSVVVTPTRSSTGIFAGSQLIMAYEASFSPVILAGGLTHWLEIQAIGMDPWAIGYVASGSSAAGGGPANIPYWTLQPAETAFLLQGVQVPEPASLGLFAAGLAGLVVFARRRRLGA